MVPIIRRIDGIFLIVKKFGWHYAKFFLRSVFLFLIIHEDGKDNLQNKVIKSSNYFCKRGACIGIKVKRFRSEFSRGSEGTVCG